MIETQGRRKNCMLYSKSELKARKQKSNDEILKFFTFAEISGEQREKCELKTPKPIVYTCNAYQISWIRLLECKNIPCEYSFIKTF